MIVRIAIILLAAIAAAFVIAKVYGWLATPSGVLINSELLLEQATRRQRLSSIIKLVIASALALVAVLVLFACLLWFENRQDRIEQEKASMTRAANADRDYRKWLEDEKARKENEQKEIEALIERTKKKGGDPEASRRLAELETRLDIPIAPLPKFDFSIVIPFKWLALAGTFVAILTFLFVPAVVSLPFSALLVFTWQCPYTFVFLRPFSHQSTSKALKRLVARGLAGFGFFYTLADAGIQQKWYVEYPVLLGQLSFLQFRSRKIKYRQDAERLPAMIKRRRLRILNWVVSKNKIFPMACVDAQWRYCVGSLMYYANIVIVDLTEVSPNVLWEIQESERLNLRHKVIFITPRSKLEESMRILNENNLVAATEEIVPYENFSKQELRQLRELVSSRLAANEIT